ncbi:MAG: hypothetical protein ACRDBX_08020 [Erysipelotrichaceae bacterium]
MKKLFLLGLVASLLGGCMDVSGIQGEVAHALEQVLEVSDKYIPNMNKKYYSYYLPTDVGRVLSTDLGETFQKDGVHFNMNLNGDYLIHNYYYDVKQPTQRPLKTTLSGTYQNFESKEWAYQIGYEALNDNMYYVYVNATVAEFSAIVPYPMIDNVVAAMMKIACSIDYELTLILNDFSAKQLIQETTKVDLDKYSEEVPDSGSLLDLLREEENTGD